MKDNTVQATVESPKDMIIVANLRNSQQRMTSTKLVHGTSQLLEEAKIKKTKELEIKNSIVEERKEMFRINTHKSGQQGSWENLMVLDSQ